MSTKNKIVLTVVLGVIGIGLSTMYFGPANQPFWAEFAKWAPAVLISIFAFVAAQNSKETAARGEAEAAAAREVAAESAVNARASREASERGELAALAGSAAANRAELAAVAKRRDRRKIRKGLAVK